MRLSQIFSFLILISISALFTFSVISIAEQTHSKSNIEIQVSDVFKYAQDVSVTISIGQYNGSGVLRTTKDGQVWVLTCGHVTEMAKRNATTFTDPIITQTLIENGAPVGTTKYDAEVIRYSNANSARDLALLRIRSHSFRPAANTRFYLDKTIPPVGTRLVHCGSFYGHSYPDSLSTGIVSYVGRQSRYGTGRIMDQASTPTFPGSSGGMMCLEADGRYIGMLLAGRGETISLYNPIRDILDWAKSVGVDFVFNDDLPIPTEEQLKSRPIED